jgi:hypothetical protein
MCIVKLEQLQSKMYSCYTRLFLCMSVAREVPCVSVPWPLSVVLVVPVAISIEYSKGRAKLIFI